MGPHCYGEPEDGRIQDWVEAQIANAPPITDRQARVVQHVLRGCSVAESDAVTSQPTRQANELERQAG
jgi:hypothetical protein